MPTATNDNDDNDDKAHHNIDVIIFYCLRELLFIYCTSTYILTQHYCTMTTTTATTAPKDDDLRVVHPSSLEGLIQLRQSGLLRHDVNEEQQHLCSAWGPAVQFAEEGAESEGAMVTHLDFGGCRLRKGLPEGTLKIFQEHFHTLQSLNLGGTDLPIKQILQVLSILADSLQSLYLGANYLCDTGATALATTWIPTATQLTTLDLRYNEISGAGCEALCEGLQQQQQQQQHSKNSSNSNNACVTRLYLEGNRIQDQGATALAISWLANADCPLQEVFLGANQIGPTGAAALARCLTTNKTLCKLTLEGNQILEEGADAFTKVLTECQGNTGLQHLFCDNNEIGKDGSKRLAEALNSATAIGDSL